MTEETTTEQLAEIEEQAAEPATEYTPPNGWQEVPSGEPLKGGDEYHAGLNRYIRRTEPQPQPESEAEPQPQPQPVQVREGRWRTRNGRVRDVAAMPTDHEDFTTEFPWWDGKEETWTKHGHLLSSGECPGDLVEYLGPIEEQPETQQNGLVRDVTHLLQESGVLDSAKAEQQIEELRSEVSYVQRLLGESRQRVTQLEELVSSLRTINEAQEKTVRLAGQENTDLQHRLNVVSAELVEQFETVRKLRIELDAAQQVPQAVNDRFEEGWDAGTARAVETIAEWLEPIKGAIDAADNQDELARAGFFAIDTIRHLPAIMRTLTGLTDED